MQKVIGVGLVIISSAGIATVDLTNSVLRTFSSNGKHGKVANFETSEELTNNKNIEFKGTLLNLFSIVANYSGKKDSYGFETNVFNLWDIGTAVDVDSSNYVSIDFYVNDKSISNYDVRSNLNISVDKSALAYAAVIVDVVAAFIMGAPDLAFESASSLCRA